MKRQRQDEAEGNERQEKRVRWLGGNPTPLERWHCFRKFRIAMAPIPYAKGNVFVVFGTYNELWPAAAKFFLGEGSRHEEEVFALASEQLWGFSPNIVHLLCLDAVDNIRRAALDPLKAFYAKYEEELPARKQRIQQEFAPLVAARDPSNPRIPVLRTAYEKLKHVIPRWQALGERGNESGRVMIMERALCPFGLGTLLTEPTKSPQAKLERLRAVAFYLLWMIYGFQQIGYVHSDFAERNIWLQPIQPQFEVIQFRDNQGRAFYVPLSATQHLLPRVGDWGLAEKIREDHGPCLDVRQASYILTKNALACGPTCSVEMTAIVECLSVCESECSPVTIERVEELLDTAQLFAPFRHAPQENIGILRPAAYHNPEIIDRERFLDA